MTSLWLSSFWDYNIHSLNHVRSGFNVRTTLTQDSSEAGIETYRGLYTLGLATQRTGSRPYRIFSPINSRGIHIVMNSDSRQGYRVFSSVVLLDNDTITKENIKLTIDLNI
jgi:hypothetical protein